MRARWSVWIKKYFDWKNPNVMDNTKPNVIGAEPRTKEFSSGTRGFLFWTAFRDCSVNVGGIAYDCTEEKCFRVKRALFERVYTMLHTYPLRIFFFTSLNGRILYTDGHVEPKKPIICLFYKTDSNKQILFATWI